MLESYGARDLRRELTIIKEKIDKAPPDSRDALLGAQEFLLTKRLLVALVGESTPEH